MALFDENVTVSAGPQRRMTRGTLAGMWALAAALMVLLVITFLPTSYVVQEPGPVYNTLGEVDGTNGDVPLIAVSGADTYPTSGTLDLTTVQVLGTRERTPSWFELALAWFDPTRAVVPIDAVFPAGQSSQQRDEQSSAMMVDSQQEATAAALDHLGYDIEAELTVHGLAEDSPAQGLLEEGDVIVGAGGEPVTGADSLREVINRGDGAPVELQITRDALERTVSVAPAESEIDGEQFWLIGITLVNTYEFPIDVTIQLNNVGGPSAGMMFALGIIDTLTEGDLNGGSDVAGTGTITADGEVGPIGGIRQKLWGAQRAGADFFLAPAANCDEVVGHVPAGLRVLSVATLDDSIDALDAVAHDADLDALPACGS